MDHSQSIKTVKTVIILVAIILVFLAVGSYYRNLIKQNSGNMVKQNAASIQQENTENTAYIIQEETGAYVNIRKADSVEDVEDKQHNSSFEVEVEEKDFTNSTEWVPIITFE